MTLNWSNSEAFFKKLAKVNASRQAIEMVVCICVEIWRSKPICYLDEAHWPMSTILAFKFNYQVDIYFHELYKTRKFWFHTYVFLLDLSPCVPCGARIGFFHFQSSFYLLLYSLVSTKRNRISVNSIFSRWSYVDVLILM